MFFYDYVTITVTCIHQFIEEQLRKGYIRPLIYLKWHQCLLQKRRIVINVWYRTVDIQQIDCKNNHPFLLISDIIENIGTQKVFTKLYLQQGYNNVLIKERSEWKMAFVTPEGSFKPIVVFFGPTNSPAIFQTMINEIL